MSTFDFDAIPEWMARNIGRDALRGVKRTMQSPEGLAMLDRKVAEKKEAQKNGIVPNAG